MKKKKEYRVLKEYAADYSERYNKFVTRYGFQDMSAVHMPKEVSP